MGPKSATDADNTISLGTFNIKANKPIPNLVLATSGTRLEGENNNVITVKGQNTFIFARGPYVALSGGPPEEE